MILTLSFSLKKRLNIALFSFALIPMLLLFVTTFTIARQKIVDQAYEELRVMADFKELQLQTWIEQGKNTIRVITGIIQSEESYKKKIHDINHNSLLNNYFRTQITTYQYITSISLLDPVTGKIFFSTDLNLLNRIRNKEPFFLEGQQKTFVSNAQYSVGREKVMINISSPIKDTNGETIAVALLELDLADLQRLINTRLGMVENSVSYLTDSYGFFITTPSNFATKQLSKRITNEALNRAKTGESGNITYTNHNNNIVQAHYRWLETMNMVLIVELDYNVIVKSINSIWFFIIILGLTLLVIVLLISYFFSERLFSPLTIIANSALALQQGNFQSRIPVTEKDNEINRLAIVFNGMAESIEHSHGKLESQVEERTHELLDKNEQLRAEIKERNIIEQKLIHAKKIAESADQAKSDFLANMSHELRTPLNGIMGMTRLIGDSKLTEEQQYFLSLLNYSAENLNQIISDLLDFSRINAGKLLIENKYFNAKDTINNIVFNLSPLAKEKKLEVFTNIDPTCKNIYSDPVRFSQIIINFLTNAIKYTDKGWISINVSIKDMIEISVSDSGIGMSNNEIKSIFNSFKQIENIYTKKHRGLGLGLSIVHQLLELMNGEIFVESTEGKGTTFTARLPILSGNDVYTNNIKKEKIMPSNKKCSILVAEDEAINKLYICKILQKQGYNVDGAKDGVEALEMIDKKSYDIVLMDISMPRLNGFDTTLAIRERESSTNKHSIIIALTAHAFADDITKCMNSGMDDFISKPIDEQEIFSKIKQHLESITQNN